MAILSDYFGFYRWVILPELAHDHQRIWLAKLVHCPAQNVGSACLAMNDDRPTEQTFWAGQCTRLLSIVGDKEGACLEDILFH